MGRGHYRRRRYPHRRPGLCCSFTLDQLRQPRQLPGAASLPCKAGLHFVSQNQTANYQSEFRSSSAAGDIRKPSAFGQNPPRQPGLRYAPRTSTIPAPPGPPISRLPPAQDRPPSTLPAIWQANALSFDPNYPRRNFPALPCLDFYALAPVPNIDAVPMHRQSSAQHRGPDLQVFYR